LQKPKEIRAFLDQYVLVKIKLKSNVGCSLQSLQTFDATKDDEVEIEKSNIIMVGQTGKTLVAKPLRKC
jgi:ATP-dependent Clp protease ATP-binding subunit ClpX